MNEGRAFFEQMLTCREPYRRLADAIDDSVRDLRIPGKLPPFTVDLGAGVGFVVERLRELGYAAFASDPCVPSDLRRGPPSTWIEPVDLAREAPDHVRHYGLTICTETAEHIPAEAADHVVSNVLRHIAWSPGARIVWSAARPGDEWPGHVNLQPSSYWLEKFAAKGWVNDEPRARLLREAMLARSAQHVAGREGFFILQQSV
jgi:hypothetical protein